MKRLLTILIMMTMPEVKTEATVAKDTTVLEVVIYKVKPDYAGDFKDVLTEARSTIQALPGLLTYQTFRSTSSELLFIDIAKWESLQAAKKAAREIDQMQELSTFIAAFEEIVIMDHFDLFIGKEEAGFDKNTSGNNQNDYYNASAEPMLIELPTYNYLSVKGISAPEDEPFLNAIAAIYEVAYHLKYVSELSGRNFDINEMEAQWSVESGLPFDQTPRDEWHWNILIPLPEFINSEQVDLAVQDVIKAKKIGVASEIEFASITEGKFVQALHIGSYEAERPTIEKIMQFIHENGLEVIGNHHEIYLTDPREVSVEKLQTILRYAVK